METKDLDVKIGTKIEAFWTDFKRRGEEAIFKSEQTIIADKHLIELAEKIIKEEQCKKK